MDTVSEVLNRIYDELDGIAGGEIPPEASRLIEEAMYRVDGAGMVIRKEERMNKEVTE